MFKYLFTHLKKTAIIMPVFLLALYVSSAQLSDNVANYNCLRYIVSQTKQVDFDQDSVYDTYGIKFCESDTFQTFPINAIGDIRRWPPLGGPTHSIAVERSGESITFLESYYDASGEIIAWFQKSSDNDTVFFHGKDDTFLPPVFRIDSSGYYIQASPNPADDHINIHYIVKNAGNIRLDFLSYEGTVMATIIKPYSCQGDFIMFFDCHEYDEGYYILRYNDGTNVYRVNVVIIR